jgi:tRNA dimethylallyltransferase
VTAAGSALTRVTAKRMAPRIWLIAGPTASGKSALALALAERLGAEIVGADSMQVYRDLRILTARPSVEEEARVPHHLVGSVDAAEPWSTGKWLRAARAALADIAARDKPAVVVGGTGLYFRALTQGLADVPDIPAEVRAAAERLFDETGEDAVRSRLGGSATAISPGDRQRLVRALEVLEATGKPLAHWQSRQAGALDPESWRAAILEPERAELYRRCDVRLQAMLDAGALDEVRALLARNLSPTLSAMKAVGVREFAAHLRGELPLADALTHAQTETRHYAKRQLTWLRNQTPDWDRLPTAPLEEQLETLLEPGTCA